MIIIKYFSICLIVLISASIGIIYSKKYGNRLRDLEEMKKALNIFKTKIVFTYEPIPEVFKELEKNINKNIGAIFYKASNYMSKNDAGVAWKNALKEEKIHTNFENSDIEALCNLSKMLGYTDLEGQISNIELVCNLIDNQIDEARQLKKKNEKLYKTIGTSIGLAVAIILI